MRIQHKYRVYDFPYEIEPEDIHNSGVLNFVGSFFKFVFGFEEHTIDDTTYIVLSEIAEGGYSKVYLCTTYNDSKLYILKRILIQGNHHLKDINREVAVSEAVHNPFVTPLKASNIYNEIYYQLIYPYYPFNSLFTIINNKYNNENGFYSELTCVKLFLGIVNGLKSIHLNGFCHRDIKPNNILLNKITDKIDNTTYFIPIIIDLGSCRPREFLVDSKALCTDIQEDSERICTASYRPPELFDVPLNIYLDDRCDVWSLGCTFYFILFGLSPFETVENGIEKYAIMTGNVDIPPKSKAIPRHRYSKDMYKLLKHCICPNYDKRYHLNKVEMKLNEMYEKLMMMKEDNENDDDINKNETIIEEEKQPPL